LKSTSNYLRCEGRELHYMDWGDPGAAPVIAWHGLARTGRDMDDLAAHLAQSGRYRVICPDTIGRGLSQWSPDPDNEYHLAFYVKLAVALMDQLGLTTATGWARRWGARSGCWRRRPRCAAASGGWC